MSLDSVRPWRQITRRKSREISVGDVKIGGGNPISVQTMTNTITADAKQTIAQVKNCAEAGAEIVRVSCPDTDSTVALKEICKMSPVPIVADIHFHYKRAIEAAEAGAACLRINPGNIGNNEKIREVIKAAKDFGCSIRIGVNAGSIEKDLLEMFPDATVLRPEKNNYLFMVAKDLRMIMAELGFKTVNEMIGRVDCLETDIAIDHWKRNGLDFSGILQPAEKIFDNTEVYNTQGQDHGLEKALDNSLIA